MNQLFGLQHRGVWNDVLRYMILRFVASIYLYHYRNH